MKKTFMNISAGTTLAVAIALASCNNAAEVKKQVEEQNAKIQTQVDEKLNGLQQQVDAECAAYVDSAAKVAFATWQEEEAAAAKKGGKKPAVKPKPKPVEPKKEEPKKEGGLKGQADQPTGGGLKGQSDQTKQSTGGGGLKGLKDKKQ